MAVILRLTEPITVHQPFQVPAFVFRYLYRHLGVLIDSGADQVREDRIGLYVVMDHLASKAIIQEAETFRNAEREM